MKYSLIILLVVTVTNISSCITTQDQRKAEVINKINSWVGEDVNKFVDSYGYPSGSFIAPNGNKVYVWHHSKTTTETRRVYQEGSKTTDRYHGNVIHRDEHGNVMRSYGNVYGTSKESGSWTHIPYEQKYWCDILVEVNEENFIQKIGLKGNKCF